jgi:creatinine amidohydrolase/Fe(II)-dependent formamide hydrolase-like protein
MRHILAPVFALASSVLGCVERSPPPAGEAGSPTGIHRVAEMNTEQIRALDREKTVVVLPGGILEEHGPYLPSFADGYVSEHVSDALARAISTRPGWTVLLFPLIPLGVAPANEIGSRYTFDGSYTVRSTTLRAVYMDLATELGEGGFRKIFLVHFHLGPNQSRALDQAADYFNDTYGGQMVHLVGLMPVIGSYAGAAQNATEAERAENGFGVHADLLETSINLFLRPHLVAPGYAQARAITGNSISELIPAAEQASWPGYLGSPRHARRDIGAAALTAVTNTLTDLALKILDGFDHRQIPRYGDFTRNDPGNAVIDRRATADEQENERKQVAWLRSKGLAR